MTGRMYLLPAKERLPRHAAVVLNLGRENFVFEDTRYFGRLSLDGSALARLGPEPLGAEFTAKRFAEALSRSRAGHQSQAARPIAAGGRGKHLRQRGLVPGGHRAHAAGAEIDGGAVQTALARHSRGAPGGHRLRQHRSPELRREGKRDGLFYFGRALGAPDYYEERLRVYDRAGQPCPECGTAIKRRVQAARSTYYCPRCQRG